MKVASLFSGCGGLDLGLSKAGHEIIMQVEIDPRCRQVLRHHYPGTLLHQNIEQVQVLPKETDVVAAGFPCQDLSSESSTRKGLKGAKTSLVRHVFRLLKESGAVPWVVLENVPGLLDRIQGELAVMGYVAEQLEALGYSWAYRIINTAAFGDPQRRRRVFVVASLHGDPRDALLAEVGSCHAPCPHPCLLCWEHGRNVDQEVHAVDLEGWRSGGCVGLMPTLTKSNGSRWMIVTPGCATPPGLLAIEDAERLQGFEPGYTWPCLRAEGVSRDLTPEGHEKGRFSLVGDAVSVPVAWYIGKRIANPYSGTKYATGENDRPFDPKTSEAWPRAAWRLVGDVAPREATTLLTRGALAELPQLLPFTPLSKFLTAIRPGLNEADVRNYVRRLKGNRFELSQAVQLKLIRTYGMALDDFQAYPRTAESVVWASLKGWRPKWYPALLQSRAHASSAVLAQEEPGKTLVVFKGEQNKWSSLWVEEVVPWRDRCPEEVSDKMDLPDEYARIVKWAGAEYDWLCRFDEKGAFKDDGMSQTVGIKRKAGDATPPLLTSSLQGHDLVGHHVEVYWPDDNSYYAGQVMGYNPRNKRPYKVYYAIDDTLEHLDLTQEQWRLLPSGPGASPPLPERAPNLPGDSSPSPSPSSEPSNQSPLVWNRSEGVPSGLGPVGSWGPFGRSQVEHGDSPVDMAEGDGRMKDTGLPPQVEIDAARTLQFCADPVRVNKLEAGSNQTLRSEVPATLVALTPQAPVTPFSSKAFPDESDGINKVDRTGAAAASIDPIGESSFAALRDSPSFRSPFDLLTSSETGLETGPQSDPTSAELAAQRSGRDRGLPDHITPDSNTCPVDTNLEVTGVLTPVEATVNPFERNINGQKAAWSLSLSLASNEREIKQRKPRNGATPRTKKVITEAALVKNPALDGAALVGRDVRVLDMRSRLWICAVVESFDASIGFRNTLPWRVRYSDNDAEYVNLCLDRCQILPAKNTGAAQAVSAESARAAAVKYDQESTMAPFVV